MSNFLFRYGLTIGVVWPLLLGILCGYMVALGHITEVRALVGILTLVTSVYAVISLYRGFLSTYAPKGLPAGLFGYAIGEVCFAIAFLLFVLPDLIEFQIGGSIASGPLAVIAYVFVGYWCGAVTTVGVFLGLCAGHPKRAQYLTMRYLKRPRDNLDGFDDP